MADRFAIVCSFAPSLVGFREALIRESIGLGHEVLCVAPDFDAGTRARVAALGCETAEIPLSRRSLNPFADFATIRALRALFAEWRPDVVMGYTPKPAIYASLAATQAGVGRIVPMMTGLGFAFTEGGGGARALARAVSRRLYRRAFAGATGAIFHNADDYATLAPLIPSHAPVTLVPGSGVDLEAFAAQPLPPLRDGLIFLMIARLVRDKGVAEFVEAARSVKSAAPQARFLLIGPEETGPAGFPRSRLEAEPAVEWLGASDDVRPHLARAHVYVLPSYREGMPRTVLEALATGRPVITTDAPGCRETVRDGVNGFLVPPRNAAALAEAMMKLLKRPDRIPRMADESRRLAEETFGVARVNAAMLDALGLRA
jgi:glycosyltransferase involved in cell wall biosynthesis